MNKLVSGFGGGGKSGGGGGRTPVESPDSLRSIQYAKVLDLISEGEIGGLIDGLKSVYLDDTPLQNDDGTFNFAGVTIIQRVGTQSQSYIEGFAASEAESPVSVEIVQALPVTRTITNPNNTAVRVTVSVPQLTFQNLENGDLGGTSVEIAIDIQTNGGGFIAQPLRKIYTPNGFAVASGQGTNTIASSKFVVDVLWTPENIKSPQTLTYEFQYKLKTDSVWTTKETATFTGTLQQSGVNGIGVVGGAGNGIPVGGVGGNPVTTPIGNLTTGNIVKSKTFTLDLPANLYDFRALKIKGTSNTFGIGFPVNSANSGGSVSVSSGQIYTPAYTDVFTGKTTSKYQRAYRIELPASGPWDVRVRRITPDSAASNLSNKTFWDSYTEIIDAKLTYPNSAIMAVMIDAKQFNNIPVRGYEISGILIKVPTNYDELTRVYTGTWDGTFKNVVSDNPAWVFYDIITTGRYGLGKFVSESQVDKWALYQIAKYCDEMVADGFGGLEPRFTCNLYLQTREKAYTVIANLASIFRGISYWGAGEITASQDAPADAEQLFTKANVIDGRFSYSGSSSKVRHTVALISWNDPSDSFRQKVEYVDDPDAVARYGVIQTEIVAMGCTSRGQAHRMGKWLIYSEQYETETVSFKAGMDSVYIRPGSVFKTTDPNRAGKRMGGRIKSSTLSQVVIDNPVILDAQTYKLSLIMPDGTIAERTLTNVASTTDTLTFSPNLPALPVNNAIWILAADNLIPELWRTISIKETDKTQLEIVGLAYRADKYDFVEKDVILQPLPLSLISTDQPIAPLSITVVESLYQSGLNSVGARATVSWVESPGASSYVLSYQREGQNIVTIDNIRTNTVDIQPIENGVYTFTVYAVNSIGRRSVSTSLVQEIYGKTAPPANVINLQMVALSGYAHLTWEATLDLDVAIGGHLRMRFTPNLITPDWVGSADIGTEIAGNSTTATLPLLTGSYLAKWVDSSGIESDDAAIISSNVASIVTLNIFETITESPTFAGVKDGVVLDGATLKLEGASLVDDIPDIDALVIWDSTGGIRSSGEYYFSNDLDLGSIQTSRLSAMMQVLGVDELDTIDARLENIDTWESIDGNLINDAGVIIYVRTTNDNPALTPVWSDWIPFFVGDWTARAFEFKLSFYTGSSTHNVLVSDLNVIVDMPDRDEYGEDIVSGTSALNIVYGIPFKSLPAVGITAQNMATGDYYTITSKTASGFTILFKNAAGTNISRTFDYHSKGY